MSTAAPPTRLEDEKAWLPQDKGELRLLTDPFTRGLTLVHVRIPMLAVPVGWASGKILPSSGHFSSPVKEAELLGKENAGQGS